MKTLIKNVRIITPNEILNDFSLIIHGGKIVDIDKSINFKEDEYVIIDGKGDYLSPGFIDIHNHGNSGYDVMDSSEEALDEMGKFHLSNGVTSYLGTIITSSYEDMISAMKNIEKYENKKDKARIIGVHLEGPFFNSLNKGAQPEKHIKLPDINEMKKILDATKGKMRMVSLAPELEGALDIIRVLKEENITIAMAHTNATFEEAKKGINHGATVATHLYNGMRSFSHREPGVIGASLTDDRVYCEIIYDRIHLHDEAVKIALKMKGYDKIILVSDAMMASGLEDGEYELGGQKVEVKDGAARLDSGNLAGSTLNLQRAVSNMVNYMNIPINEVVKMATINPAKAINMDENIGSIELGKNANLIIFDNEINIKKTILGGQLVWEQN